MKVVHIELPRRFTLTVKEYLTEVEAVLRAEGHEYLQYDSNPHFWKWLLGLSTPHSPRDLLGPLLAARGEELWPILAELKAHLLDVSRHYGMPVSLNGIRLERAAVQSSYAMCTLAADNFGGALFSNFFQHLEARLHFLDADVITLGLDYQEGVFWAVQFAAWLKAAGCKAPISIARHAWENFSLVPHIEDLSRNTWFFGVISSVMLHQEELPRTMGELAAYLSGKTQERPHNIALMLAGGEVAIVPPEPSRCREVRVAVPEYVIPRCYFQSLEVPPEHLVYSMAMVRNRCFYHRCNFCAQTAKHISARAYEQGAEVQRALAACGELIGHGVTMVNFMDESMRPVDIRAFCAGIQERTLRLHWVGRMIAAANPNRELLRMMKEAGCVEILFGLETFDPRLSADMGKVSGAHDSAAETAAMIASFLEAGLFVIMSLIYEFPTETPEARRQTLQSIAELETKSSRLAMIFNRFQLMQEATMFRNPERFNISRVEQRLPENDLQYHFGYECREPLPGATAEELATMERLRLGLTEERYAALGKRFGKELLEMAFYIDNVSLGLAYRVEREETLLAGVLRGRG